MSDENEEKVEETPEEEVEEAEEEEDTEEEDIGEEIRTIQCAADDGKISLSKLF